MGSVGKNNKNEYLVNAIDLKLFISYYYSSREDS